MTHGDVHKNNALFNNTLNPLETIFYKNNQYRADTLIIWTNATKICIDTSVFNKHSPKVEGIACKRKQASRI